MPAGARAEPAAADVGHGAATQGGRDAGAHARPSRFIIFIIYTLVAAVMVRRLKEDVMQARAHTRVHTHAHRHTQGKGRCNVCTLMPSFEFSSLPPSLPTSLPPFFLFSPPPSLSINLFIIHHLSISFFFSHPPSLSFPLSHL